MLLQLSEMIGGQKYNWFIIIIFIIIDDDWTRIRFICVCIIMVQYVAKAGMAQNDG